MVLLDLNSTPYAVKVFECELWSLDSDERLVKYKYEPIVTINNVRQCCRFKKSSMEISKSTIDDDDDTDIFEKSHLSARTKKRKADDFFIIYNKIKTVVQMEFKNYPEYITIGNHIIVNEASLKAFGYVTNIISQT